MRTARDKAGSNRSAIYASVPGIHDNRSGAAVPACGKKRPVRPVHPSPTSPASRRGHVPGEAAFVPDGEASPPLLTPPHGRHSRGNSTWRRVLILPVSRRTAKLETAMPNLTLKPICKEDLPRVQECFLEAFADYAMSPEGMTVEKLIHRSEKNGFCEDLSIAAYDNGKMVGFSSTGLGPWKGETCAFDIMTGIIKAYRGQGLAGRMFAEMRPGLEKHRVRRFLLEVLQVNEVAIRAYQKVGFTITGLSMATH
ncbi:GNAT family N-acetyltransferase [bacterium]|nr:GNAT family N-acetyltransferase [bacterium]